MTCDTVGPLLLDYVEGELAPDQARSVRDHVDQCPACAARLRETRGLLGDLGVARSADQHAWSSGQSSSKPPQLTAMKDHTRIGDFEILAELGRGGMGVVYRARQISLDRVVALKLLSTNLVQSERAVSRFAREAQAAARLHHTNIVPIYAQGREQDYFYYAMELVEGDSLDKVLRQERARALRETPTQAIPYAPDHRPSPLTSAAGLLRSAVSAVRLSSAGRTPRPRRDFKRIVHLITGAAEGLHHAHEQGIIHRDIKPQNLLLGPDGQLHITDFGLARVLDQPGLTLSSELVGTPAYMAPEQITAGGTAIDRRTDIYALGVTFYETLTLQRPFQAETYDQTINLILNRDPRPPRRLDPRIPTDLETICLRALEKEPQRRFPTAADLARDLRRHVEGFPIVSRPLGPVGKTIRWVRRHPWKTSAIAATALLLIVIPLGLSFFNATANDQINRGRAILLDDYREKDRAVAQLGWASRIGGNQYRRDLVEAFADVRTEPQRSIDILERALDQHPDDPEAHYLLAWAYTRRAYTQGVELWAEAQRHIAIADALDVEPSAAGWFFRGQAVWGTDPEEAVRSFDRAISKAAEEGFTFTQAMLHQGRAMNQIMYSWRDISYYRKAIGPLESAARLQPTKAYPRYLLSLTHMLAAEIYWDQGRGRSEKATEAFEESLRIAREAQLVEPSSPRGYAAEADYHESRGKCAVLINPKTTRDEFEQAIAAWNQFDNPSIPIRASASDWSERFAYQMRLHYWLGDCAKAETMRQGRYSDRTGYRRQQRFDPDEAFYEAIIAAGVGKRKRAEDALAASARLAHGDPEQLLLLRAAYQLIGSEPPPDLLHQDVPAEARLSPGWTAPWLAVLISYERGQSNWHTVEQASRADLQHKDDARLRMAGAYFHRGVSALADRDREQALELLTAARDQHDNENYCFRAELLMMKLRLDPDWPPWLGRDQTATP